MNSIKFVDELPGVRTGWDEICHALRQSPDRWAEVARFPRGSTSKVNSATQALNRRSDIESARRTIDGEIVVFARAVTR